GRSRLLGEMTKRLEARRDIEVWIADGDPVRSGTALDMLAEAVRRLASVLDGEPAPVMRQKLRALAGRHVVGSEAPRVAEFLGELVHVPPGDDDSLPLRAARADAMLMGEQVRRALEDLLDAHARAGGVVLVLEDLHWGDPATIAFIDRALRNLAERPLFVVALSRPELHEQFPRLWAAHNLTELRLGPLPRRADARRVGPRRHRDRGAPRRDRRARRRQPLLPRGAGAHRGHRRQRAARDRPGHGPGPPGGARARGAARAARGQRFRRPVLA